MEMLVERRILSRRAVPTRVRAMINSDAFTGTPGDGQGGCDPMAGAEWHRQVWRQLSLARLANQPATILGPRRSRLCISRAWCGGRAEDQLPVLLPDDLEWKPTGESPLKLHNVARRVPGVPTNPRA